MWRSGRWVRDHFQAGRGAWWVGEVGLWLRGLVWLCSSRWLHECESGCFQIFLRSFIAKHSTKCRMYYVGRPQHTSVAQLLRYSNVACLVSIQMRFFSTFIWHYSLGRPRQHVLVQAPSQWASGFMRWACAPPPTPHSTFFCGGGGGGGGTWWWWSAARYRADEHQDTPNNLVPCKPRCIRSTRNF